MSQQNDSRFSRRYVIHTGLLAGVAAALPASLLAADAAKPLITKAIPSTGEKIPVIGVGTNQFGRAEPGAIRDVIRRMNEVGATVIDTAAMYDGSEVIIGSSLKELNLRPKMFIATKFNAANVGLGRPLVSGGPPTDPVGGLDSFERSLQRLQIDKVDLMMIHGYPSVELLMPVLQDLKKKGRTRYIGITTVTPGEHTTIAGFMRKYPVDFVQVQYSLGDRSAEKEILPLAQERKIAVMAAQPFGGGRNLLLNKIGARKLPPWAADLDVTSWAQLFLKYVVSHPAVTVAIPGYTKVSHLEDNQAAGRGRLPDAATRRKIEEYWASGA
jgi:aryl-alcohol dehydrogenase-like predicted oxidoreductase